MLMLMLMHFFSGEFLFLFWHIPPEGPAKFTAYLQKESGHLVNCQRILFFFSGVKDFFQDCFICALSLNDVDFFKLLSSGWNMLSVNKHS